MKYNFKQFQTISNNLKILFLFLIFFSYNDLINAAKITVYDKAMGYPISNQVVSCINPFSSTYESQATNSLGVATFGRDGDYWNGAQLALQSSNRTGFNSFSIWYWRGQNLTSSNNYVFTCYQKFTKMYMKKPATMDCAGAPYQPEYLKQMNFMYVGTNGTHVYPWQSDRFAIDNFSSSNTSSSYSGAQCFQLNSKYNVRITLRGIDGGTWRTITKYIPLNEYATQTEITYASLGFNAYPAVVNWDIYVLYYVDGDTDITTVAFDKYDFIQQFENHSGSYLPNQETRIDTDGPGEPGPSTITNSECALVIPTVILGLSDNIIQLVISTPTVRDVDSYGKEIQECNCSSRSSLIGSVLNSNTSASTVNPMPLSHTLFGLAGFLGKTGKCYRTKFWINDVLYGYKESLEYFRVGGYALVPNDPTEFRSGGEGINQAINVYPNPVSDRIYFDNKSLIMDFNYKIFGSNGKQIGSGSYNSETNDGGIDISDYYNGIYFIKIEVKGKEPLIKKFIKIK